MAGFSFGTPTTSAPSFSFGSNTATGGNSGFNFGAQPTNPTTTNLQFSAPASTGGTFTTPAATGSSGFNFGSSGGLSMGTPAATTQSSLSFKPGSLGGGLSFGSPAPATSQQSAIGFTTPVVSTGQSALTFGSAPTANQQTLSFGSTPATSQPLTFGALPTTSQPVSFGGAPSTAAQPSLSFGSATATNQPTLNFGSTPATSQPTLSFGSTAATTQPTLSFGSTPATTQPTLSFGNAPATSQPLTFGTGQGTTQPTLGFGTTAATTQAGLSFGNTPATTQSALSFGLSAPASTATTGLSLATPASATPGLSFGLGTNNQTATTTTSAPSLLNFSTPKTTASTGFSLSVSGAGTGTSLFTLPTTSAPTTSAPVVFKGLGGVDTSTTQGSGQKDAKSVKENIVDREIMQTLDTFKNFVKQQKTLSCEVSRAPVKPMHKVSEDTEALRQLLTSVSSALQKNRVVANKLKTDTTKCLSLCEMAQRTHDTPPGLQNDNIAPLEFFIQLVSKFERDIQVLRQEIDNTEKHVNSLSYPAILTPQELSVALRRLHDSFVALAGRLQSAHASVIAQKERHLSLRRHFLKDHTNIFETTTRTPSAAKKSPCGAGNFPPMPGPTPFSSMGGMHNISLIGGTDKTVTFSTGPSSLSGWGSSMSILNTTPASSFLQSPGTTLLSSPQPVDNQNFQLGKPPPGNKRGKR